MQKLKIPTKLQKSVAAFVNTKEAAREKANAQNRQKTVLRNDIKEHWTKEQLPIGSYVRTGGLDIKYEASESTKIDPGEVLNLFEKGEINRDQFLRMVNIDKAEAKKVLGGDQVADFEVTETGTSVDIRISDTPIDEIDEEFIAVMQKPIQSRVKKRRRYGGKQSVSGNAPAPKPRRKIKTKVRK